MRPETDHIAAVCLYLRDSLGANQIQGTWAVVHYQGLSRLKRTYSPINDTILIGYFTKYIVLIFCVRRQAGGRALIILRRELDFSLHDMCKCTSLRLPLYIS